MTRSTRCLAAALLAAVSLCACASPVHEASRAPASYADVVTYADHTARMHYLDLEAGRLAYIDEGQGEPVVLIHGIPTSSWMYRKVIARLVASGHRVIAPDLMGLGASARTEDEQLGVEAQAKHLAALLLDELELHDWVHVVHDFGGPVTWALMQDPRVSIRRLVILDTFAFERGWSPDLNCITQAAVSIGVSEPFNDAFYRVAICGMLMDESVATDTMLQGYCRPILAGGSAAYKRLYFSSNELKAELPRYQRTLAAYRGSDVRILWGRHDEFLSADDQVDQLVELLAVPEASVQILEDVGHLVAEEAPDNVVRAILD